MLKRSPLIAPLLAALAICACSQQTPDRKHGSSSEDQSAEQHPRPVEG